MATHQEIEKNTVRLYLAKNGIFSCFIYSKLLDRHEKSFGTEKNVFANLINSLRNLIALDACKLIDDREKIYTNLIEKDPDFMKLYKTHYATFEEFINKTKRYRDKAGAHCDYQYLMSDTEKYYGEGQSVCFGYIEIYEKIFGIFLNHLFKENVKIKINGEEINIIDAHKGYETADILINSIKKCATDGVSNL
jgi:hypothetical protein